MYGQWALVADFGSFHFLTTLCMAQRRFLLCCRKYLLSLEDNEVSDPDVVLLATYACCFVVLPARLLDGPFGTPELNRILDLLHDLYTGKDCTKHWSPTHIFKVQPRTELLEAIEATKSELEKLARFVATFTSSASNFSTYFLTSFRPRRVINFSEQREVYCYTSHTPPKKLERKVTGFVSQRLDIKSNLEVISITVLW